MVSVRVLSSHRVIDLLGSRSLILFRLVLSSHWLSYIDERRSVWCFRVMPRLCLLFILLRRARAFATALAKCKSCLWQNYWRVLLHFCVNIIRRKVPAIARVQAFFRLLTRENKKAQRANNSIVGVDQIRVRIVPPNMKRRNYQLPNILVLECFWIFHLLNQLRDTNLEKTQKY
jgi:hypothetical protein